LPEILGPIEEALSPDIKAGRVLLRTDFIPYDETEVYFKSADVFVLPYRHIYQSGVLFLGHGFGVPVLAADVGSLRDDIVEGRNGLFSGPKILTIWRKPLKGTSAASFTPAWICGEKRYALRRRFGIRGIW